MIQKLYNFVIWLIDNITSICLVFIVLTSVHPFVSDSHGHNYYTALGIFFAFISTIFTRWHVRDGIKESKFYYILCIIIMALGVVSLFFSIYQKLPYTDFDLFMTTYFGSLMGLVGGTFVNDLLNSDKKEKELKKQMLLKINVSKIKLNWIDVTKKMPSEDKEVLCKNTKGSYFVGYINYENIGHKTIYQCSSGDEAMSNVIYWIELSEIEKTIPENL